ncbi:hypothetical protein [Vulcanisaeta sp. JCM 16161]|uniref:hypothetical protein n=1 Tax=Vulcanisaeta sp. JCM 16161 TaxID=1295372 RepID=UPI000A5CA4C3
MTTWLRIVMRRENNEVITCALANTGFEGLGPDILMPINVAQRLGLNLLGGTEVYAIRTASGVAPIYRFRESVSVRVLVNDRDTPIVRLIPIASESVDYVILSDKALTELGIVIIDASNGIWYFRDELGRVFRTSCTPD